MFGFEVKTFEANHVTLAQTRDQERDFLVKLGHVEERLQAMSKNGPAWSIFKDGQWIASGGCLPIFPHVADYWQVPSIHVEKHIISYGKFNRWLCNQIFETLPYTRLQTLTNIDTLHHRWMSFLNFQVEGIQRGYGLEHQDMYMWARLKDG